MKDVNAAPVGEKLKPILKFCRKLTESPARMTQADADAVFKAGWEERALEDAIAVTALFNLANRLVDGHGIQARSSEDHFQSDLVLKEKGYDSWV